MKFLYVEDGGMVLYIKCFEEGIFRFFFYDSESCFYFMEWCDLVLMVEGIIDNLSDRFKCFKVG